MNLSLERHQHIENLLKRKFSELAPKYRNEIVELKRHPNMPTADRKIRIDNKHVEHMQEIANALVETYLEHYRAEHKIPDENEIIEIKGKLTVLLLNETAYCDSKLPMNLVVNGTTEKRLNDILENAAADLRNARTETELENKTRQEQQKRFRVLKRIYEESNGDPTKGVRYDIVRDKEQMPIEEVHGICTYLSQGGLLRRFRAQKCFITSEGINKVETELLPQKKIVEERFATKKVMDFSFVAHDRIRTIIERDYAELQGLDPEDATKSVLVLCGSIIEGLLLDAIVTSGHWTYQEASERFLKDMIHPARIQGIIQHDNLSEVLRVFRNLIHPAREIRDNLAFDSSHAKHARAAVDVIINEIRKWSESRKP
jgi:hypothetical protein